MRFPYLLTSAVLFAAALLAGCSHPEPDPIGEVAKTEVLERGKLLVYGLAACGFCHGATPEPGAPLTGGRVMQDSYGLVTASNLTQLPDGLGNWEGHDVVWALRSGNRPDGTTLSQEVHRGYEWMSDRDLIAIASYLRSVKGAGEAQERRELGFFDRNVTGFWLSSREVRGYVPTISQNFPLQYGKYLADNVARCASCHNLPGGVINDTSYLAGGAEIRFGDESKISPGLTNSVEVGLGAWTETDIIRYLRTGLTPSGRNTDSRFCPTKFYALAGDGELKAMAKYIKSVQ